MPIGAASKKQLDPELSEVKPKFEDQSILFAQFDMTDDFTISQSKKMANMFDLSELFRSMKEVPVIWYCRMRKHTIC